MQQATLAQSVEQRIRNAQVVSSSLMSGSRKAGCSDWNFPLFMYKIRSVQILDHPVVKMSEEEDLTVGAKVED